MMRTRSDCHGGRTLWTFTTRTLYVNVDYNPHDDGYKWYVSCSFRSEGIDSQCGSGNSIRQAFENCRERIENHIRDARKNHAHFEGVVSGFRLRDTVASVVPIVPIPVNEAFNADCVIINGRVFVASDHICEALAGYDCCSMNAEFVHDAVCTFVEGCADEAG